MKVSRAPCVHVCTCVCVCAHVGVQVVSVSLPASDPQAGQWVGESGQQTYQMSPRIPASWSHAWRGPGTVSTGGSHSCDRAGLGYDTVDPRMGGCPDGSRVGDGGRQRLEECRCGGNRVAGNGRRALGAENGPGQQLAGKRGRQSHDHKELSSAGGLSELRRGPWASDEATTPWFQPVRPRQRTQPCLTPDQQNHE